MLEQRSISKTVKLTPSEWARFQFLQKQRGLTFADIVRSPIYDSGMGKPKKLPKPAAGVLSSPISFHRVFVEVAGSVTAGLFLSYLWHHRRKTGEEWVGKTYAQWRGETGLTRSELDRARRSLKESGLLKEKQEGSVKQAILFYSIDVDALFKKLDEIGQGGY